MEGHLHFTVPRKKNNCGELASAPAVLLVRAGFGRGPEHGSLRILSGVQFLFASRSEVSTPLSTQAPQGLYRAAGP